MSTRNSVHQNGHGVTSVRRAVAILTAAITVVTGFFVFGPGETSSAQAVTGSDFTAGTIISDVVMYNDTTMTVAQIQAFLNSKVSKCTSGYTCLKSYTQTTTNYDVPKTGGYTQHVCAPYVGASNESAATIIYKVAHDCDVNPQALLVILQKEEGLVTSTRPSSLAYRSAMGYGCPDTAACNSDFYGFFKQVFWAARAMQRPVAAYKPGVTSNILYSPTRSCGTKSVTVTNKATSNLYTYTPYVPNRAALKNLDGTGDSCSSYGNRNFWTYFNSWFGSTVIPQSVLAYVQATYADVLGRTASSSEQYSEGKYLDKFTSRKDFAHLLLTSSEYRKKWVASSFVAILGRPATSTELTSWVSNLSHGTLSARDLVPALLGTDDYYANKADDTKSTYIADVYQYELGRAPTADEVTAATKAIGSATKTQRTEFATTLYKGVESSTRIVSGLAPTYLQRPATPDEVTALLAFMKANGYNYTIAHVIGSAEYLTSATTRFPVPSS